MTCSTDMSQNITQKANNITKYHPPALFNLFLSQIPDTVWCTCTCVIPLFITFLMTLMKHNLSCHWHHRPTILCSYLVLHELPAALQIFYDNAFLKHKVKQNLITTTCAADILDILRILVFSLHLPSTAWPACSCPPCSTAWPWQWWLRWPCQGRHRHRHRQPPSFSATEMPVRRVPRGDHVESDNLRPNFDSSFGLPVLDHQP